MDTALIFANPATFEKAKMDLPDDKTWTWDPMIEIGCRGRVQSRGAIRGGVLFGSTPCSARSSATWQGALHSTDRLGFDVRRSSGLVRLPGEGRESQASERPRKSPRRRPVLAQAGSWPGRSHEYQNSNQLMRSECRRRQKIEGLPPFQAWPTRPPTAKPVQGIHALVRFGQDREPGRGGGVDRLVARPGGGRD